MDCFAHPHRLTRPALFRQHLLYIVSDPADLLLVHPSDPDGADLVLDHRRLRSGQKGGAAALVISQCMGNHNAPIVRVVGIQLGRLAASGQRIWMERGRRCRESIRGVAQIKCKHVCMQSTLFTHSYASWLHSVKSPWPLHVPFLCSAIRGSRGEFRALEEVPQWWWSSSPPVEAEDADTMKRLRRIAPRPSPRRGARGSIDMVVDMVASRRGEPGSRETHKYLHGHTRQQNAHSLNRLISQSIKHHKQRRSTEQEHRSAPDPPSPLALFKSDASNPIFFPLLEPAQGPRGCAPESRFSLR